jgi:NAD(P)-dependent dehydrogenase (short-subunit alcohol dehydrogenase family)
MSRRVHSRYQRRLPDTAMGGCEVAICLVVRRFLCLSPQCAKVTFAEQVTGLTSRYARRTPAVTAVLEAVALALGGRAGARLPDDLTDPGVLERHLAVNLFGTYAVTQAFLPALARSRGVIVNILSVNALAPLPFIIPAYSVSKAAAFSLTQSLRARVAGQGARGKG